MCSKNKNAKVAAELLWVEIKGNRLVVRMGKESWLVALVRPSLDTDTVKC